MISKEDYLRDPCGTLSIPLWKWKGMTLPDNMQILHHREYSGQKALGYAEETYFRLFHPLDFVKSAEPKSYSIRTAAETDIPRIVEIINASYGDISVTEREVHSFTKTGVYAPELWLLAVKEQTGEVVGCAIADLDRETGEGILEWVQVLPEFRRQGIGKLLVSELLRRMQGRADFATVSGKCENTSNPEGLYRSCGFRGRDVWHIMRKA